jgi:hypothetical protein
MANYGGVPQPGMRASDADRERAVDVLKAGFAEGRLNRQEYEARVERAYRAATYGQLAAVVADLPQGPVPPAAIVPAPGLAYGPPRIGATYLPVPARRHNSLAVASLLCGLAGVVLVVPALPAIVLGHQARRQIRHTGEDGEGPATAGMVLGYVVSLLWAVLVLVMFAG